MALLLITDADLNKGRFDILLNNVGPVRLGRHDRGFIEQVLQIRACKACCRSGHLLQIDVFRQGLASGMDLEDFLAAFYIRSADRDLSVKTSGTQNGGVQDIGPVGRRHDDDAFVDAETVHLDQQLVEGLLTLIVGAAQSGASAPGDRVDLIDENDTGGVLFGLIKHVPDTGSADTDEHLDEIRTGDAEERYFCLSRDGLGQQGLTGSGNTFQQNTLGDPGADFGIFGRIPEEIDDFRQIFLFLLQTGHIVQGDPVALGPFGLALAEVHHLVIGVAGPALVGHHMEEEDAQDRDQDHGHDTGQEAVVRRYVPDLRIQPIVPGLFLRFFHVRHIQYLFRPILHGDDDRTGRRFSVGRDHHAFHILLFQIPVEIPHGIGSPAAYEGPSYEPEDNDQEKDHRNNGNASVSVISCCSVVQTVLPLIYLR